MSDFHPPKVSDIQPPLTNLQDAFPGSELAAPLVVRVKDGRGVPIKGSSVTWQIGSGNGQLQQTSGSTGEDGLSTNRWTLGSDGDQAVLARLVAQNGSQSEVTFTASLRRANLVTPERIELVTGGGQTGPPAAELPVPLTVRVTNKNGQAAPGVAITWVVTSGNGTLFETTSQTGTEGHATNRWTLGTNASLEQRVEARVSNPDGSALSAAVVATIRPVAVATAVIDEGDRQWATVGKPLTGPLAVKVFDSYGNPVPDVTVSWQFKSGRGRLEPASSVTGESGIARTLPVLGTVAGPDTVLAIAQGKVVAAFHVTARPDAAVRIEIPAQNVGVLAGDSVMIRAAPVDVYGNVVTDLSQTWRIENQEFAATSTSTGFQAVVHGIRPGTTAMMISAGVLRTKVVISVQPLRFSKVSVGSPPVYGYGSMFPERTNHACGLTVEGKAFCWGYRGSYGELGWGRDLAGTPAQTSPTAVVSPRRYTSISAGGGFTCAIATDGFVDCWGANNAGQLGVQTETICFRGHRTGPVKCSRLPVRTGGGMLAQSITAGGNHVCILQQSGVAYCWGGNETGQLGDGTRSASLNPVRVQASEPFDEIYAGDRYTCALGRNSRRVFCWGSNEDGRSGIGDQEHSTIPLPVSGGLTFSSVRVGPAYACGQTSTGVFCWGKGYARAPIFDQALQTVAWGLATDHRCAIDTRGAAVCWGTNASGQLGTGSQLASASPAPVATQSTFRGLSVGGDASCAITDAGFLYCWGHENVLVDRASVPKLMAGQL